MTHRLGDMFAPPGLTNFLGCVQADLDPVALRNLSFPPFSTAGGSFGGVFINDTYFRATGHPVTFTWYPDRIVREAEWDGWFLRSTIAMVPGQMAVLTRIEVTNRGVERDLSLRIGIRGGIVETTTDWAMPEHPESGTNDLLVEGHVATFVAPHDSAAWSHTAGPTPEEVGINGITWGARVRDGGRFVANYVTTIADNAATSRDLAVELLEGFDQRLADIRTFWTNELASVFSPGNDNYSGSLPILDTNDEDLRRIYYLGALGVVYFKRDSAHSVMGRTYDTLMPSYWQSVTFVWDYALSGMVHGLLDPVVMKKYLEHWMSMDMHTCFGSEYLTGGPVGGWYSVNDYAMSRLTYEYLRWTGDRAWLDTVVPLPGGMRMTVREHVSRFATNYERFLTPNGLADYGGLGNLLECVSTYIHEVAAMNAGNVWMLRLVAELAHLDGDEERAIDMRLRADSLVQQLLKLYVDGAGVWHSRFPDGSLVEVRHVYDFITVMATIADDLTERQRQEMASFCLRELTTPTWMRALSVRDSDAAFSVRPDHQWNGAYPAWPPQSVSALYRAGRVEEAFDWMKGLARSANQGPFGQAHFVSEVIDSESGGARKAPSEMPYINDWTCSSNGSWVQMIIESVFGVKANLDGTITAEPAFGPLDPDARLIGLVHQGQRYDVDRNGITKSA